MLIDGLHIPVTTPFTRDGAMYLRKLEYNVGRYSLTPAAGFVALAGEGAALSDLETADVLQVIGSSASPEKVLVAVITRDSVRTSLAVAERAAAAGFDAVLLSTPSQWQTLTNAERTIYFQAIADASPLPVMLSSAAAGSPIQLSVEFVAVLSSHPNILGSYEFGLTPPRYRELAAATRMATHEVTVTHIFTPVTRRMLAASTPVTMVTAAALSTGAAVVVASQGVTLKTRIKSVGFQIMSAGSAYGMIELLEAGVAGAMPDLAAAAPQGCYEPYAAFKDGDVLLAAEKEQRLKQADSLAAELGVGAVKYGCDLNGYFGGNVRLPRLSLDAAQRLAVECAFSNLKN